jgi:hypothetical protein
MIRIYEKETRGEWASILRVAAGTTGKKAGNKSLTVIEIENICGDFGIELIREKQLPGVQYSVKGVRIIMGGDQEIDSITEALEFILGKLKAKEVDNG